MVEHITVVIALLDIPHLEEPRSRSHFGKRMIAGDVAATRNFSEPALCKAESAGISNAVPARFLEAASPETSGWSPYEMGPSTPNSRIPSALPLPPPRT